MVNFLKNKLLNKLIALNAQGVRIYNISKTEY